MCYIFVSKTNCKIFIHMFQEWLIFFNKIKSYHSKDSQRYKYNFKRFMYCRYMLYRIYVYVLVREINNDAVLSRIIETTNRGIEERKCNNK